MRLLKKFFSYFRRQPKEVSPPTPNSDGIYGQFVDLISRQGSLQDVVNDEASFQNIVDDVCRNQLTESIKEWISIGSDHGLVEIESIDEDGEFGYVLTAKGMKFNEIFTKMNIDPDSTEAQGGVLHLDDGEEWVVEVLMDMGMNMREADDDDEWRADDEGEMI